MERTGLTFKETGDAYRASVKGWPGAPPDPDSDPSSELDDGSLELCDGDGDTLTVVSPSSDVAHVEYYVFTIRTSGYGTSPEQAWRDVCDSLRDEPLDEDDVPEWEILG